MGNKRGQTPRSKKANNYKHIRKIKTEIMTDDPNDLELGNSDVSLR